MLFDDSPFCVAQKSHFQQTLVYQRFSVVPLAAAVKKGRTRKLVKFLKVVLCSGRQGKSAFFSLTPQLEKLEMQRDKICSFLANTKLVETNKIQAN